MGAWIETPLKGPEDDVPSVAPYMGAWIETLSGVSACQYCRSHPTWVRGLKLSRSIRINITDWSHPTWVRGLKLFNETKLFYTILSRTLHGCVD